VFHLYCCRKNSKLNIVAECIMKVYSANTEGTIYISCNIEYNALAVYSIQKCQTTVLFKYWNYIFFMPSEEIQNGFEQVLTANY
jgi:hypothetical protein